jgi:hypothetical protein
MSVYVYASSLKLGWRDDAEEILFLLIYTRRSSFSVSISFAFFSKPSFQWKYYSCSNEHLFLLPLDSS